MPTLNKKLFFITLGVAAALAGGVAILHAVQSGNVSRALLAQADRAAADGEANNAIRFLQLYLEREPGDADAVARLADLVAERGNDRRAQKSVLGLTERVLRLDPAREDARRRAVGLCLRFGRYHDAAEHAQKLIDAGRADAEVYAQLGTSRQANNKYDEAAACYRKAVELDPTYVDGYWRLASLLANQFKKQDEAGRVLDTMVGNCPHDAAALRLRAAFLRASGRDGACERDLDRLLELDPEDAEGLLMLAGLRRKQGRAGDARELLREGFALYPRRMKFCRQLAWLEMYSGNRAAALACLERAAEAAPDRLDLFTPLGDLLAQAGRVDEAKAVVRKLEARKAPPTQVEYLKARVRMAERDWAAALAALETLQPKAVGITGLDAQTHVLMAECRRELGDLAGAQRDLSRALRIAPGNMAARVNLGNLYVRSGDWDRASRTFASIAESPYASLRSLRTYGRLRIARAVREKAGGAEWDAIAKFAASVREKYPQSAEPVFLAADLMQARGQHQQADALLSQAVRRLPGEAKLWARLAEARALVSGLDAGSAVLDEARTALGDRVALRLARATLFARSPSPNRLKRIARLGQNAAGFPEPEQVRLLFGLADVYAGMGADAELAAAYRQLADRLPEQVAVRAAAARLAVEMKDREAFAKTRAELAAMGPQPAALLAALDAARDLGAGRADLTAVRSRVARALKLHPGSADLAVALAEVAAAQGDKTSADAAYRQALRGGRSRLDRVRDYARFLASAGQFDAAGKVVMDAFADPRVGRFRFQNLYAAVTDGLPADAQRTAAGWLAPVLENDATARVWLGGLLERRGLAGDARRQYAAATRQSPKLAEPYLFMLQAPAGRKDAAAMRRVMADAKKALGGDAYFALAARSLILAKELGMAGWKPPITLPELRKFVAATVRLHLARGEVDQVQSWFDRVAEAKGLSAADRAWGARNAAMMRAVTGDAAARKAAVLRLRDMARRSASAEDRRALAGLLAAVYPRLRPEQRQAALAAATEALAAVTASGAATDADWYQLARFYRLAGKPADAHKCLSRLVAGKDEASRLVYTLAFVSSLLSRGELGDAERYVAALEAKHGGDVRAVQVAARYHAMRGDPKAAGALIDAFVRGLEPGSDSAARRTRQAAGLLAELSRVPEDADAGRALSLAAAKKYRSCLAGQPDALVPLVESLARGGDAAAAFAEQRAAAAKPSGRFFAGACLAYLRSGAAGEGHYEPIREWLKHAAAARPNDMAPRLGLGEYYTLRRDFAAAERAYRDVLKVDPKNVAALNNLAWLLAADPAKAAEAESLIAQAIELTGRQAPLLDTRARVRITRGRLADAETDLKHALASRPTSLRYFHLAVARLKGGRQGDAVRAFRLAKRGGLSSRDVHPNDRPVYGDLEKRAAQ